MSTDERNYKDYKLPETVDLLAGIWRRKLLVAAACALGLVMAVFYLVIASPQYVASMYAMPPTQNDVARLNYGRGKEVSLDIIRSREVYKVYIAHLQSEELRQSFFRDHYLPMLSQEQRQSSQDELYARFNKILMIDQVDEIGPRFRVAVKLPSPTTAVQWISDYIAAASVLAKEEVLSDAASDARVIVHNIERQIRNARESERKQRDDRIARLEEALRIARAVGLERPPVVSSNASMTVPSSMEGALTYMRGSKAIEAEISNLKSRDSDDPFINDLRQQQAMLDYYEALKVDPESIKVYRQDGAIEVPDNPVWPKKSLVIAAGLFMGLFVGLIMALIAVFRDEAIVHRRALPVRSR